MSEAIGGWVEDDTDMFTDLLTTSEAATIYRVTEDRIRQWKRRGLIHPTGSDEFGRHLYRGVDVLRALAAAEDRLTRAQAQLAATRRAIPVA